jgi:preprotein translocase subunit SecE
MEKLISFFKASWEEITVNVTWPPFNELQSNTTLVLVGSLIFAFVVGVIDFAFENALNLFYQSF